MCSRARAAAAALKQVAKANLQSKTFAAHPLPLPPTQTPPPPQDGKDIKPSERIAAAQDAPALRAALLAELAAEGVDAAAAEACEDDGSPDLTELPEGAIPETGYVDEAGELRRPWCPATRILEHREAVGGGEIVWGGGSESSGARLLNLLRLLQAGVPALPWHQGERQGSDRAHKQGWDTILPP